MEELLSGLNNVQQQAVLYNNGPSLIIAGAGSGKTRVLTYKIAALIKLGLYPSSILALTFTNKAAREMKSRIADLVGESTAKRLWMGTFHSIFLRILRLESEVLGFDKNFTIYDTSDAKNLLKSIIKELNLDDKTYKPSRIQARISYLKNNLITPNAYKSIDGLFEEDRSAKNPLLNDIYRMYAERCVKSQAMDFDDILLYTNILFRDNPEMLEKYRQRFQYVLVDEYQDTNFSQHLILKRLTEVSHRICVVGDDAQSIYSFRGANIRNILNFKNDYPEYKLFKLEQNYRSTKNIVGAANSLIFRNKDQIKKLLFSENEKGSKVKLVSAYSDIEEAFIVANSITGLLAAGNTYKDIAVLYRTNAQSRLIEEALRKKLIPYRIYGGLSFYQRKEIKDIIAYFKMAVNPYDEEALKRTINNPGRGIGETTVQKILETAQIHNKTAWEVIKNPLSYNLPVNSGTMAKLGKYKELIECFINKSGEKNAFEAVELIVNKSGILEKLLTEEKTVENISRQENIRELLNAVFGFVEGKEEEGDENRYLIDFLSEVSLLTDQDEEKNGEGNKVTLLTIHASKGLEYKNIFIVGLEEELFPSQHSIHSESAIEEERRLFYVAITRAEKMCTISYAKSRYRNGSTVFCKPSRFLQDIDPEFMEIAQHSMEINSFNRQTTSTLKERVALFNNRVSKEQETFQENNRLTRIADLNPNQHYSKSNDNIKTGTVIVHERFGKGTVIDVEYSDGDVKIHVDFENAGVKKLLLKFAKFRILE